MLIFLQEGSMIYFFSIFTLVLSVFCNYGHAEYGMYKHFNLTQESIDVVIPCTEKDLDTLEMCIEGIKNNCSQIRRIIVVSASKLTDNAEWFNEVNFPFKKYDVALEMFKGDKSEAENYISKSGSRVGWYYQQLLKFYAPFVVPEISSNVLILDSDTVFLNPVEFLNSSNGGLFNPGFEYHIPYFEHINKLMMGNLIKWSLEYSGISHHMFFQKPILNELFEQVENINKKEFWRAFCCCVDKGQVNESGASEYEIYFNFALQSTNQVEIRLLKWANLDNLHDIPLYKEKGYHYVSCHTYCRI